MDRQDLIQKEIEYLRQEMRDLKTCQVTFVTVATTATGGVLGFIIESGKDNNSPLVYLLPLVFLLPAWLVFFEKATTITRIVGYYRILENLILGKIFIKDFLGWENAQSRYRGSEEYLEDKYGIDNKYVFSWDNIPGRDNEKLINYLKLCFEIDWVKKEHIKSIDNGKGIRISDNKKSMSLTLNDKKNKVELKKDDGKCYDLNVKNEYEKLDIYDMKKKNEKGSTKELIDLLFLRKSPYWMLVYYIFFVVSIICWGISILFLYSEGRFSWISIVAELIALLVFILIAGFNFYKLRSLVWGRHSYDKNQRMWEEILNVESKNFR